MACGKQVFHSFLSLYRLDDIVQNVYVIIVNVAIIEQKKKEKKEKGGTFSLMRVPRGKEGGGGESKKSNEVGSISIFQAGKSQT